MDISLKMRPPLDVSFMPMAIVLREFEKNVLAGGCGDDFGICIEHSEKIRFTYRFKIFNESSANFNDNFQVTERLVKSLVWVVGGYKVIIGGSEKVFEHIKNLYRHDNLRARDLQCMERVFEKQFEVVNCDFSKLPNTCYNSIPVGGNLNGRRIGFDAGGSDRKASAVIDGEVVFSEETIWRPKENSDYTYHYDGIRDSIKSAAKYLPGVDAIGVSTAGIVRDNRVMSALLFDKIPRDIFNEKMKDVYLNIAGEFGDVPVQVVNDGDVTALAGFLETKKGNLLGIAMGTAEAGGYVDASGNILGWLNELASVPVDFSEKSTYDNVSKDYGLGVDYFSQDAVIRLAENGGIAFGEGLTKAEKLAYIQTLHKDGNSVCDDIFKSIGIYLGYTLAYYALFYVIENIMILGRVTSGEGGVLIKECAEKVINLEFPELEHITVELPDESNRRVGQSIAAASLPKIRVTDSISK